MQPADGVWILDLFAQKFLCFKRFRSFSDIKCKYFHLRTNLNIFPNKLPSYDHPIHLNIADNHLKCNLTYSCSESKIDVTDTLKKKPVSHKLHQNFFLPVNQNE